jgi:CheY-like chemotaxis protein
MDTKEIIRVTLVEDSSVDREIFMRHISKIERSYPNRQYEVTWTEGIEASIESLNQDVVPDIVFLDLNLPGSMGLDTLGRIRESIPPVPIVVLTTMSETVMGQQAIQMGAQDYLQKDELSPELLRRVIDYSRERFKILQLKDKLILELKEAEENIRELHGIIPICAWCKNIRNDDGYWEQVESYMSNHTQSEFTHSICPTCESKLKNELVSSKRPGKKSK